jgi:GNAT superfamily N-acetyltransferase
VGVSVRIAGEGDGAVLAALRRAWGDEAAGGPVDDPGFEARFLAWWRAERGRRTFFLAEVDGAAVGMANVTRVERMPAPGRPVRAWGHVGNVFVLAAHRDAGVGEALMRHVVAWARDQGLVSLRLAPSPRSRAFYERLGFRPGTVVELPTGTA